MPVSSFMSIECNWTVIAAAVHLNVRSVLPGLAAASTSHSSTRLASCPFCSATTRVRRYRATCIAAGSIPLTGRSSPLNASSAENSYLSRLSVSNLPRCGEDTYGYRQIKPSAFFGNICRCQVYGNAARWKFKPGI